MTELVSFSVVSVTSTPTPIFLQLVPQIALILTAVGILVNLSRDIYATQTDTSGLVPIEVYTFISGDANGARTLIPRTALLVFMADSAIAFVSVFNILGIGIVMSWRGQPHVMTDTDAISNIVGVFNMTIVVITAYLSYRVCRIRSRAIVFESAR